MNKLDSLLALAAVSSLLTACSQGQSAPPAVTTVNPGNPSYSKLQLAVGNVTYPVAGTFGINVVSTLRQPNGLSAVLLDTPSLSGPWTLLPAAPAGGGPDAYATILGGGPSLQDVASNALSGTPLTVHLGAPACDTSGTIAGFSTCPAGVTPDTTTFGQSGGVFGMGFQPANSTTNTTAVSYVPYAQPIFATTAVTGAVGFTAFGGPPSFHDSTSNMGWRDGLHNLGSGVLGWNEGINIFDLAAAPGSGAYTLNVSIPTGQNSNGQSSFATVSATANLSAAKKLPTLGAAPVLTLDGAGGGSVTVVLPAGATEGYVQIVDLGPGGNAGNPNGSGANCQGTLGTAAFPVYYTIFYNKSGTYSLPDTDGPNTTQGGPSTLTPSPSICTAAQNAKAIAAGTPGDTFTVQQFAMDYPLFEASYPNNNSQAPALTGAAGQADVTLSPVGTQVSP